MGNLNIFSKRESNKPLQEEKTHSKATLNDEQLKKQDSLENTKQHLGFTYNEHKNRECGNNTMNSYQIIPRYKGLPNLGTTCYANSTIQCLYSLIEFRNAVLKESENKDISRIFDVLGQTFKLLANQSSSRDVLKTIMIEFMAMISFKNPNMTNGNENDPASFLLTLLNGISINNDYKCLNLFCGEVKRFGQCEQGHKQLLEVVKLPTLDILPSNYYDIYTHQNSFYNEFCKWNCSICEKVVKQRTIAQLISPEPDILVIKLEPQVGYYEVKSVRVHQKLKVKAVEYRFYCGVFGLVNSQNSVHFEAVVMDISDKNLQKCTVINDLSVYDTTINLVTYYPRLLFYKKL